MTKLLWRYILIGGLISFTFSASANDAEKPPAVTWSFNKLWGTFDRASLQRGFQVYKQVCATCHSVKYMRYEKLSALGFSEAEIKAIASEHEVPGPINDNGEPTTRKATPADFLPSPFPNDQAARAANNGALPPDLTLMAKAREFGTNYIQALLTGYVNPPKDFHLVEGMHYNKYFPGHQIAMPAPLMDNQVEFADGTKATIHQMAHDVTTFLAWTAEPEMEARKQLGLKVIIYLIVFSAMLYVLKRRAWKDVK